MIFDGLYEVEGSRGIKRIEIPKVADDFLPSNGYGLLAIKKYLPKAVSIHRENAQKEQFLYDYYLGQQDILKKQRLYQKDAINNNRICENHALRQVDFKTGFITSEQREYTAKEGIENNSELKNDLTFLNRYFADVNFFGKDKTLKEWIYITGVGCTDVRPRTDIVSIDENGNAKFKTASDGYDIRYEAPFEFNVVSPIDNFVVYSSGRSKEPLFCVSMVEVEKNPNDPKDTSTEIEYQIETKYAIIRVKSNKNFRNYGEPAVLIEKKTNFIIPIVEHSANNARLGVIEKNKSLFDAINTLVSATTDMVVDNANVILVFKNTDIDSETIQSMKSAGAIIIKDTNTGRNVVSADLDTIKVQIDYAGLNTFYEQRLSQAYDIVGVPLASGQVTSGGDTGQARLLGGGWSNATTISTNETNTMRMSDYEVLRQILYLCKLYKDCPLNLITASQIDIKYKLNSNDNFLVKAQGIANLYNVNMPKDVILKASGLVSDVGAVSVAWEDYDQRIKQSAQQPAQTEETQIIEE